MSEIVWTQWDDLVVPPGFTKLSPNNRSLDGDISDITFYVPLYMGGRKVLTYAKEMKSLKYFQLPNAGFEDALEFVNPGVTLLNARGVHDASTAELAVALSIACRRGFIEFFDSARENKWNHKRFPSLNDSKIFILGAGSIAQMIEKYLTPYQVEITKFSRSGVNGSTKISELDTLLPQADVVILALPLNSESTHLFNQKRLALMKDGAAIINVARGPVIETSALITELKNKRLFAGLDVTDPEPLPDEHELWKVPNCIITPHVGGDSTAFEPRGKKLVEEQLMRIYRGEKLINIVN